MPRPPSATTTTTATPRRRRPRKMRQRNSTSVTPLMEAAALPPLEVGSYIKGDTGNGSAVRAPCPALNTLANHGYISRDGRNISRADLTSALTKIYGLRPAWAFWLTLVAMAGLGKKKLTWRGIAMTLDLNTVNKFGHLAPLFHRNPRLATGVVRPAPVSSLVHDVVKHASGPDGTVTLEDFATARVKRQSTLQKPIPGFAEHTAQGELALMLLVMGDKQLSVTPERIESFVLAERLPDDFVSPKQPHIRARDVFNTAARINQAMHTVEKTAPAWSQTLFYLATATVALVFILGGFSLGQDIVKSSHAFA